MHDRRGFTLLELAMVVAVSGLMLGFVMKTTQTVNTQDCYATTRQQMATIKSAIDRYAMKNERFPLPSQRNVGVESPNYGREAVVGNLDVVSGAVFGAIPFQVLGIPVENAADCWGNKYTYVVTQDLTDTTKYVIATTDGKVDIKTNVGDVTPFLAGAGYALISHGEDQLGAVKNNYSTSTNTLADRAWCTSAGTNKTQNCALQTGIVSGVFNNGKDAGTAYFDDLVVYRGKPWRIVTQTSNVYCWGTNTYGTLGDGTNTQHTTPNPVTLPSGVTQFGQITAGTWHACAIGDDAKTYCWGYNGNGQLGDGTIANSNIPKAIVGYTFVQIAAGNAHTCGLTAAGAAYCWGYNQDGNIGDGSNYNERHSVTPVTMPGGVTFNRIYAHGDGSCAISTTNDAYCWGNDGYGQLGNGAVSGATTPALVLGGLKFAKMQMGSSAACGTTLTGDTYCWGSNGSGTLANAGTGSFDQPHAVSTNGSLVFTDITMSSDSGCAITGAGAGYCWGFGGHGQLGYGWVNDMNVPTGVAGGKVFDSISGNYHSTCGITTDRKAYCWGRGDWGNIGNGSTSGDVYSPTQVTGSGAGSMYFDSIATGATFSCARNPLPPVAWGDNTYGQVGDSTTISRTTGPVYMTMPSGVNYFTAVSSDAGGVSRCAISDTGAAYCVGYNNEWQLGDGTATESHVLKAATMPVGVSFTKIVVGRFATHGTTATGNLYYWGRSYALCDGGDKATPYLCSGLYPGGVTAVTSRMTGYAGYFLGSDGKGYYSNGWMGSGVSAMPAGVTSFKAYQPGDCILGNDDQIYCVGGAAINGNNAPSDTSAYGAHVTNPPGVTSWKELSAGFPGGGAVTACGIGNNDHAYCWGEGSYGLTGANYNTWYGVYEPGEVTMPPGVTGFSNLYVGSKIVTAKGNDGVWYYWGMYEDIPWVVGTVAWVPAPLPLPPGAKNYRYVQGRSGLVY